MRAPLALILSVVIACPAPSWGGFKSVSAPSKGVSVPGVSVSLPAVSIPSVSGIAFSPISLPTAEVKFANAQSVPFQSAVPKAVLPAAVPLAPAQSPVAPLIERLIEPMGDWSRPEGQGGREQAAADFERRAFGAPNQTPSGGEVPSSGSNGPQRLPPPDRRQAPSDPWHSAALEFGRAKRDAQIKEKSRGRLVYASAAAMVLLPLSAAGAMKATLLGWWDVPALMTIGGGLVAVGVGLMAAYLRAWVRASKAYGRLERAAAGVHRAAGARDADEARRALQDADALANAVFAVEALAPKLAPLAAALRRDQAKLEGGEVRALEALERILSGRDLRGDRGLSAQLASDGRAAILARRRLLWDEETLSAKEAAAEDSSLDALARRFAKEANLADDADKDFQFLADRLDRLYETQGPLAERHVALALSAAGAFKWAEFGRGRTTAGKRVMVLEALLKRQARNDETDPEKRKAQARAVLESIVSAFDADSY